MKAQRLSTLRALMDTFVIACIISIIPIDVTTSTDKSVTAVTCLNTMVITYANDTVTHKLRYVELQSGSIGYSLYERK